MVNIAIFASGSGTNAETIMNHFEQSGEAKVVLVLTNNPNAGVIERANRKNIPYRIFGRKEFYESDTVVNDLKDIGVQIIVLAGFLWLVPQRMLGKGFDIVNIHPSLLPKHGGKGMYGHHVHEAVLNSGDTETGITIHLIDEEYDKGQILLQEKCSVESGDTVAEIAKKVQLLEHKFYPKVLEELVKKRSKSY